MRMVRGKIHSYIIVGDKSSTLVKELGVGHIDRHWLRQDQEKAWQGENFSDFFRHKQESNRQIAGSLPDELRGSLHSKKGAS